MTNFTSVKKFMETFAQEVKTKAEFPSDKIIKLRYDLIKEELDEFEQALKEKNLKEVAEDFTQMKIQKIQCQLNLGQRLILEKHCLKKVLKVKITSDNHK